MTQRRILIAGGGLLLLILAVLLAFHGSYSPGRLSKGHHAFGSDCGACHQAWRGVQIASTGCLDCHGGLGSNVHRDLRLDNKRQGLVAGKFIAGFESRLACLSCHTDHRGGPVNLAESAGTNCSWCHQHYSIDYVSAHRKHPMLRRPTSRRAFKRPFSHAEHLKLLIKREAALQSMPCQSCHLAQPAVNTAAPRFSLVWKGCAGSGCHVNPQDKYLQLPLWGGAAPVTIPYWRLVSLQHLNALFEHSPGHLRSECAECHNQIEKSTRAGSDAASRQVANCFGCHAHQPAAKASGTVAGIRDRGLLIESVTLAGISPTPEKKIADCTGCHAFHVHGTRPDRDFIHQAPIVPPHRKSGLRLTVYVVGLGTPGKAGLPRWTLRRVTLRPWWLGLLAFVVTGIGAAAYVRYLPAEIGARKVLGNVAPQRMSEVPRLDDTYQSNVPGLYIVGEAGGTASINLAMRTGRQAVGFIANSLKFEQAPVEPEVYDIAIVGCGPAGVSAATTAKSRGLKYVALEKLTAVSTIRAYPRGKFVQATPIEIAEYGSFYMENDNSKEGLLRRWEEMLVQTGLEVNEREEVNAVVRRGKTFEVKTASGNILRARYVVLAIGVRGSPRRLGVAGEVPDRVFYNLVEPGEFQDKRILVVGGGNAGCEVAQALANPELRNTVGYSFRDVALKPPVTPENAEKIAALQQSELLTLYPSSVVKEIKPGKVVLAPGQAKSGPKLTAGQGAVILTEATEVENDFVFAMLGAELPTRFLKSIGVAMIKKGS